MPELAPPPKLIVLLAQQPGRIAAWTEGLSDRQLAVAPAPGEWSLQEILAHLRACADVWGGRLDRILAEDHPIIRAVNPTTWIEQTDYRVQPFSTSFEAYRAQRSALLTRLDSLSDRDWRRSATVLGAGRPLEHSVHRYVEWIAVHERQHLGQIRRTAEALQ